MKKRELMMNKKCTGEPGSPVRKKKWNLAAIFPGVLSMFVLCMCVPMVAHAGGLQDTNLVQGVKNLAEDASKVGVFLEAFILGALEIKEGIALQAAATEEKAKHKKNMISMAGVGVIIICITALIPVLFSYFQ